MEYFLMRRDEVITVCDFSDDGDMIAYSPSYKNYELSPLGYRTSKDHLKRWWKNRQIPVRQGRVSEMLAARGLTGPGDMMIRNLGLSLTDYYWIKPVGSSLKWRDVNLFENDFKENLLDVKGLSENHDNDDSGSRSYSPNSTLRGELEKSWVIRRGQRVLIKGNHGASSAESINEVFASKLHEMQKYDNYTRYRFVRIRDKKYDWGCYSRLFTDTEHELVSAYDVINSEPREEGVSVYEHLINVASKHGMDENVFRRDLEYQIMTDYLLTNVDRHMENIGILRNADTLRFIRMAPIVDTGRAFASGAVIPYTDHEIDNVEVNSFEPTERKLLELVTDTSVIDPARIPEAELLEEMYHKDSKAEQFRVSSIVRLYKRKKELLELMNA